MSEHFDTPKRCADCPGLCTLRGEIAEIEQYQHDQEITALSLGDKVVEALVGQGKDPELAKEVINRPNSQEVLRVLRQQTVEWSQQGDGVIEEIAATATRLAGNCEGQLKMRAKAPDGRTVTVTVCGSSLMPEEAHEFAHVTRQDRRPWFSR